MITLTKEWLLKTIEELEEERDATPGAVNEDAAMALAAMKLALASLEADSKLSGFVESQEYLGVEFEGVLTENIESLYVTSNHAVKITSRDLDEGFDKWYTGDACGTNSIAPEWFSEALKPVFLETWRACRAAMLQGAEQTNYRAIVERIAEIIHGKVTDIDLLTVTVKSIKDNLQGKASLRDEIRSEHAEWSQSTFGDVGPVGPLKHLSKEALEAAAEPEDLSEWADMQFLLWDAQRRAGITDEKITQALIDKLAVNKARQWPEPKDGEPRLHIKDGEPRLHIKAGLKLEGKEKQKK